MCGYLYKGRNARGQAQDRRVATAASGGREESNRGLRRIIDRDGVCTMRSEPAFSTVLRMKPRLSTPAPGVSAGVPSLRSSPRAPMPRNRVWAWSAE